MVSFPKYLQGGYLVILKLSLRRSILDFYYRYISNSRKMTWRFSSIWNQWQSLLLRNEPKYFGFHAIQTLILSSRLGFLWHRQTFESNWYANKHFSSTLLSFSLGNKNYVNYVISKLHTFIWFCQSHHISGNIQNYLSKVVKIGKFRNCHKRLEGVTFVPSLSLSRPDFVVQNKRNILLSCFIDPHCFGDWRKTFVDVVDF